MKKIITLFAVSLIAAGSLFAGTVTVNVAKTVAASFYGQTFNKTANTISLAYTEHDASGEVSYYVFNINDQDGFVIVSAEDAGHPIIGCSNTGAYSIPEASSNMNYWMKKRNAEIAAIRSNHASATNEITDEWTSYQNNIVPNALKKPQSHKTNSLFPSNSTFLMKSTYDQESPYWDDCPGTGSNKAVTGCVATTMTQIMRYWQYPATGQGSSSYNAGGSYGTLKAKYNHPYGWASMALTSPPSTDTTLARAMSDAGISVEMSYSPSGSGAYVITLDDPQACAQLSYSKYFKYSTKIMHGVYEFSDTVAWQDTLEHDLDCSRPIEYVGSDPSEGGHTWVCDGYNSINFFHMNWGWSGMDNGWYSINNLNPNTLNFSQEIEALIGIMPPAVTAAPAAHFTASSKTACTNNVVQYYDTSSNQPTSWSWTFTGGSPATSTLQNPTVSYSTAGVYPVKLVVSNGFGSDSITASSYITAVAAPVTPTITRVWDTLICNPSNCSSYVWTRNNVVIAGATTYKLLMTSNGVYKVTGIDNTTGCSSASGSIAESAVGINELSLDNFIKVYPNPTRGPLQVEFNLPADGDYKVSVTNVLGQTIYTNTLHISGEYTENIDLSSFTKGVYFLSVIGKDSKGEQKILLY
ncbi:MAG TPA: C10 family peptidase [Bacteroidia bacterium]|nr:C10 family peptidase [Bacteroidia bacterium]